MSDTRQISDAVFQAIGGLNRQLPRESQLAPNRDTVLSGEGGRLDSLGMINLIVAMEQKVEEQFGVHINLTDESLFADENGPFRTVGSLIDYLAEQLEGRS